MKIILAKPRGFCAGVDRAIQIVDKALEKFGPPIYVKNAIVHNDYVVKGFEARGVKFVRAVEEIPDNAVSIFSAHGSSKADYAIAEKKSLQLVDSACPLVLKVHKIAEKYEAANMPTIILIGHKNHPEVLGTKGRVKCKTIVVENIEDVKALILDDPTAENYIEDPLNIGYITQTTLSVDDTADIVQALKQKLPNIQGEHLNNICYATQNRQDAVKAMLNEIDVLLVFGSQASSNSNRLRDVGTNAGIPSYLINYYTSIDKEWLKNASVLGITAGASCPEQLVQESIEWLKKEYNATLEERVTAEENILFQLPKVLRDPKVDNEK